jgi:hypothetical protein
VAGSFTYVAPLCFVHRVVFYAILVVWQCVGGSICCSVLFRDLLVKILFSLHWRGVLAIFECFRGGLNVDFCALAQQ